MAKTNRLTQPIPAFTHEGAKAAHINPEQQLRRLVMSCMLWEHEFYIDGVSHADLVKEFAHKVKPTTLAKIAIEAREKMNLRHVPLLLCRELLRRTDEIQPYARGLVAYTIARCVKRPDEMGELLAIYQLDGKDQPLSNQLRRGLDIALRQFDEYQLAKWNKDADVEVRDIFRLVRPKPNDDNQARLWRKVVGGYCATCGQLPRNHVDASMIIDGRDNHPFVEDRLATPWTWEVELSKVPRNDRKSRADTWFALMIHHKLPAMAFLRNLRNIKDDGLDKHNVMAYGLELNWSRVLPFRFIAAARAVPQWEDIIERLFLNAVAPSVDDKPFKGRTTLLVDVSGSMDEPLSAKSDLRRIDAACGLAMILRELCEEIHVCTFSSRFIEVPPRHGFALRDAIVGSQPHSSTELIAAIRAANGQSHDRLVVISDEQAHRDRMQSRLPEPIARRAYMLNVASARNGMGYGRYVHLDGFSESVVHWMQEYEGCAQ